MNGGLSHGNTDNVPCRTEVNFYLSTTNTFIRSNACLGWKIGLNSWDSCPYQTVTIKPLTTLSDNTIYYVCVFDLIDATGEVMDNKT